MNLRALAAALVLALSAYVCEADDKPSSPAGSVTVFASRVCSSVSTST